MKWIERWRQYFKNIYVLCYCDEQTVSIIAPLEKKKQRYFKIQRVQNNGMYGHVWLHLIHHFKTSQIYVFPWPYYWQTGTYWQVYSHIRKRLSYVCNRVGIQYGALMTLLQINYRLLWYFSAVSILFALNYSHYVFYTSCQKGIILMNESAYIPINFIIFYTMIFIHKHTL